MAESLAVLYEQGVLCDVTLITSDAFHITTHSLLLCAACPSLLQKFTRGRTCSKKIHLNLKRETLSEVLRYMYYGTVDIELEYIGEMIAAAKEIGFPAFEIFLKNYQDFPQIKAEPINQVNMTFEDESISFLAPQKGECVEPFNRRCRSYSLFTFFISILHFSF